MASINIDPANGSDFGLGTESSPYRTFLPVNNGSLWNGNSIAVKTGTTMRVNSATRANILAASGCLLTSYGDAAAPLPIIDAEGTTFNPVWLQNGAGIIVEKIHVTRAPGDGILVGPTTGNSLTNCIIRDLLVTENTQNSTLWGTDGLKIGTAFLDGGTITGTRIYRVVAKHNGGHGMKARGNTFDTAFYDCVSIRNGLRTPAHGLGTAGNFVDKTAGAWTDTGTTAGGGKIWEKPCVDPYKTTSTSWFYTYILGAGPLYYKLPYSATPSAPLPGECGIGANNTVRINIGARSPTILLSVMVICQRPENARFYNCGSIGQLDGITKAEGDGVYFDNGSYKCFSYDCWGIDNEGYSCFLNDNTECGHYRMFGSGNLKGGASSARGDGTNIFGGVFNCLPNTPGINYSTGSQRASARFNTIIGASIGIKSNDSGTNAVAEDENVFIGVSTRLSNISSPGARSKDLISLPSGAVNIRAYRARIAAMNAELVK